MAAKSKRIKDKLLFEAYTPPAADEDGYSDGKVFAEVVGNRRFHSFQVWRKETGAKATCIYGLSLKQIEAIIKERDAELKDEVETTRSSLETALKQIHSLESLVQRQQMAGMTEDAVKRLREEAHSLREENQKLKEYFRNAGQRESMRNATPFRTSGFEIITPTGGATGYRLKRRPR